MGVYKGSLNQLDKLINNKAPVDDIKKAALQTWRNGLSSIEDISDFIEDEDAADLRNNISLMILSRLEKYMGIPEGTILDVYENAYEGDSKDFYFVNFDSKFFRSLGWGTYY